MILCQIEITSLFYSLPPRKPSCTHTILASIGSHEIPHMVPHIPLTQNSTRPVLSSAPSTKRTSPVSHLAFSSVN